MKPSLQFLELIATNSEKLFDNVIHKEINRRKNVSSIFHYMKQSINDGDTDAESTEGTEGTEGTGTGMGSSKKVLNNKKSFLTLEL